MFLAASKAAYAGIVFLLLTTWISGPRPTTPSRPDISHDLPEAPHPNDVNKMQQTLLDKGHYRGRIDGVFGLRTRASIRAFQKAEKLPVTGQLDTTTAVQLGVTPEAREGASHETNQSKPSAGIKRAKSSRRSGKAGLNPVKTDSHVETGRRERERKLEAENDPQ